MCAWPWASKCVSGVPAGGALAAGSAFGFGVAAGWGMVFTFSNGAVS